MASEHNFEAPERFIVGTVGRPGERAFYLQVVSAGEIVTAGLEKAEVAALAEGLQVLLQQVAVNDEAAIEPAPVDSAPLETPFAEDFRVSELSVAWDGQHVIVEAGGSGATDESVGRHARGAHRPGDPRFRLPCREGRRRRAPAVRAVRPAGRPRRPRLPASELTHRPPLRESPVD